MDVPGQVEEGGRFLPPDRLVPVLQEVAVPVVPPVEGPRVSRQEGPPGAGDGPAAGPHQEMPVGGQPRPRGDLPWFRAGQRGEPRHEVGPVPRVAEHGPALAAPRHDMVPDARPIQTGTARPEATL